MSISLLSIKSEESKQIVDHRYKCFLEGQYLMISDGINKWKINQAELSDLEERLMNEIETLDESKANTIHSHTISQIDNLQTTLDNKSNTIHSHEFANIYKTIVNEDQSITTKTLNEVLGELELGTSPLIHTHNISQIENLQTTLNNKASLIHTHSIDDIYKTIVNQDQTTTTKSLETILNERELDIRTFIQTKADFSHTHNATQIAYNDDKSVKQEIDRINSRISKTTTAGAVVDIFDVIFGTAADAGLQYEVSQLQAGLAALEAQVSGTGLLGSSQEILEAFDSVGDIGDTIGTSTNWLTRILSAIRSWISGICNGLSGYANVTTEVVSPLIAVGGL